MGTEEEQNNFEPAMNTAAKNNNIQAFGGLDFFHSQKTEIYKQNKHLNCCRDISSSWVGEVMAC